MTEFVQIGGAKQHSEKLARLNTGIALQGILYRQICIRKAKPFHISYNETTEGAKCTARVGKISFFYVKKLAKNVENRTSNCTIF